MKKKMLLVAALLLAMPLNGCASGPPKGMAQQTYDLGNRFLDIYESYEKGVLTEDEFYEKYQEVIKEELTFNSEDLTEQISSINVGNDMNSFNLNFLAGKDTSEDIQSLRDHLKGK